MLRLEKLESLRGAEATSIYRDIVDVFIYDAADVIRKNAVDAINSFAGGEDQQKLLHIAEKLSEVAPINTKEARRRLAAKVIDDNKYDF